MKLLALDTATEACSAALLADGAGRLLGLTAGGDSWVFAKNNVQLSLDQVIGAGKRVFPMDYRGEEWAGACFDPAGEVLFVNIQRPCLTLAVWGPWR